MVQKYDISSYSTLNFDNSVFTVSDIVSNKGQNIYKQLYNTALMNYIRKNLPQYDTLESFKNDYIIIENPSLDYNTAPKEVSLRSKSDITKSISIDLEEYWPNYSYINGGSNDVIMTETIYANYELISVDFMRNLAIMKNKENNIEYSIPLNKIDKNTPISEDFRRNIFGDFN